MWRVRGTTLFALVILTVGLAGCGGGESTHPLANRPPSFRQAFFANMLDPNAITYKIGRYFGSLPRPAGAVAHGEFDPNKSCVGVAWPSVTRDRSGGYVLYATERPCDAPGFTRVLRFTSSDGVHFGPGRPAIKLARGETGIGTSYVVFDSRIGKFRAWYAVFGHGGSGGLRYAESSDGVRFRPVGGVKAGGVQFDYVFRVGSRWYLSYTRAASANTWTPGLMTFKDPRQARYDDLGTIGRTRPIQTTLSSKVRSGATRLRVKGGARFHPRDLVVIAKPGGTADVVQVVRAAPSELTVAAPLVYSHRRGEYVALADAHKISPSYICRRPDGTWSGIFTVFQAVKNILYEPTLVYRAPSVRGPWTVDDRAAAPALSLRNGGMVMRSVENPTPVANGPDVQTCP